MEIGEELSDSSPRPHRGLFKHIYSTSVGRAVVGLSTCTRIDRRCVAVF